MLGDFVTYCLHHGLGGLALLLIVGGGALVAVLAVASGAMWALGRFVEGVRVGLGRKALPVPEDDRE